MASDETVVVKLEIEALSKRIAGAVLLHVENMNQRIEGAVKKAVDSFDLQSLIELKAKQGVARAVGEAIDGYFSHGPGAVVIREAVWKEMAESASARALGPSPSQEQHGRDGSQDR